MRNLLAKACAWLGIRLIYAAVNLDTTNTATGWGVYTNDGRHIHIIPLNDSVTHEHTEDCPCGPEIEPVKTDDGTVNYVISHHSLDGREHLEEA